MHGSNEEPQWLSSEEQEAWLGLLGMMMRLSHALDAQTMRDAGVSRFEYGVLTSLSQAPGRTLRMSELAGLVEGSLSRLSQVVGRLEKREWVRRTPDPADGRYTLAILTDEGWDTVVSAAPAHVAEVRRLVFDPLTKRQVAQLEEITRRVLRAIGPCDDAPPRSPR